MEVVENYVKEIGSWAHETILKPIDIAKEPRLKVGAKVTVPEDEITISKVHGVHKVVMGRDPTETGNRSTKTRNAKDEKESEHTANVNVTVEKSSEES